MRTPTIARRILRTRSGIELAFTALGFGTAPLGNLYRALSEDKARGVPRPAWEAGCRYFDTARQYGLGLAETRLNGLLRERRSEPPLLSTKVGRLLRLSGAERTGVGKFFDVPSRGCPARSPPRCGAIS
jgi:D-threo-aldose 1-dehydrogenase